MLGNSCGPPELRASKIASRLDPACTSKRQLHRAHNGAAEAYERRKAEDIEAGRGPVTAGSGF